MLRSGVNSTPSTLEIDSTLRPFSRIASRVIWLTSFFVSSSWISLRNFASTTFAGALPGRNPGMRATLRNPFTTSFHSLVTKSGGNSICKEAIQLGRFSTSTFMQFLETSQPSADRKAVQRDVALNPKFGLSARLRTPNSMEPVESFASVTANFKTRYPRSNVLLWSPQQGQQPQDPSAAERNRGRQPAGSARS